MNNSIIEMWRKKKKYEKDIKILKILVTKFRIEYKQLKSDLLKCDEKRKKTRWMESLGLVHHNRVVLIFEFDSICMWVFIENSKTYMFNNKYIKKMNMFFFRNGL